MKRLTKIILISMLFAFFNACGSDAGIDGGSDKTGGSGGTGGNGGGSNYANYPKEFWGEWVEVSSIFDYNINSGMDGRTWYITKNSIKVGRTASGGSHQSPSNVTFSRESDRLVKVSYRDGSYSRNIVSYLYASRIATSSFKGNIVGDGSVTRSVSRAIGFPLGNSAAWMRNLQNNDAFTITTDNDGNYTADNIIAGDEYEITVGGQATVVLPNVDGDDVGTIAVTSGVNFKATIRPQTNTTDMDLLFASTGTGYGFNITIENTGTTDCTAATYELELDSDLTLNSGALSNILGTIEPRKTKTITLNLSCVPIQNEYEFKKIKVKIKDNINNKSWDDSVSIKFNKASVRFRVQADNSKNEHVFGLIVVPNGKAYYFSTPYTYGYNSYPAVNPGAMPWYSKDYLVVFMGAKVSGAHSTEAVYSLGINVTPYYYTDFAGFLDVANYEPNDTEDTAYRLYIGDKIMSYLHKDDIDYYRVNLGTP